MAESSVSVDGTDQMSCSTKEFTIDTNFPEYTVKLTHSGSLPKNGMGHNLVIAKTSDTQAICTEGMSQSLDKDCLKRDNAAIIVVTAMIGAPEHRWRPEPGIGVHVGRERLDRVLPALDSRSRQISGDLLVGEPGQHRRENLFLGPQQGDPVDQMQPGRPRYRPVEPHRLTTLRDSHQMRENRILCESPAESQVNPLRRPR
ncbi:hypothetical protein [Streptomyces sp. NPDC015350]|uniref:hypothetical protein n=1 Tax=Streptomyces sp. NPDC015350 TaxID=3364955 RepID=UPI0036F4EABF